MDRPPAPARPDLAPRPGPRSTGLIVGIVIAGVVVSMLGYRVYLALTDSLDRVAEDFCATDADLRSAANDLAASSDDLDSRLDELIERFDQAAGEFESEAERALHEGDPALSANLHSLSSGLADLADSARSQDYATFVAAINRIEIVSIGIRASPVIVERCIGISTQ